MLIPTIRSAPLLGSLVLALTVGRAQVLPAPADSAEPALPRYRIEVIVFAHNDGNPNEEIFDHGLEPPEPVDATSLGESATPDSVLAIEPFIDAGDLSSLRSSDDFDRRSIDPGTPRVDDRSFPSDASSSANDPSFAQSDADGLIEPEPEGTTGDPFEFIDPFGRLSAETDTVAENDPIGFQLLASDDYELNSAYGVMNRLGAYRVLGHGGWEQDGVAENAATPVDLGKLGIVNPRGTLTLYLGRFLHVVVDLEYTGERYASFSSPASSQATSQDSPAGGFDNPFLAPVPLSELPLPRKYRLDSARHAIRSGELHYLDHPLFGVLVRVVPAPEEEEPEDGTEPLGPAA